MRNRDGALTGQCFGKFSHTDQEPVGFHIQVDRTLDSHTHFPGIIMIKKRIPPPPNFNTHLTSLKREKLACVIAAFIDYMPGNIMHATEMNIDKNNHICFLFVTAIKTWKNLSQS